MKSRHHDRESAGRAISVSRRPRWLDGSDAMHTDPDYSAAYVVLRTDAGDGIEGHGLTFTTGAETRSASPPSVRSSRSWSGARSDRSSATCAVLA